MYLGEVVNRVQQRVEFADKSWRLTAIIRYTGNHYNVKTKIRQTDAGFFQTPDKYERRSHRADSKDEVEDTIEDAFGRLVEHAKGFEEARDIDVDISVK